MGTGEDGVLLGAALVGFEAGVTLIDQLYSSHDASAYSDDGHFGAAGGIGLVTGRGP
jgi:hypothetical protein